MYKATKKNSIITRNTEIKKDDYSELIVKNIGETSLTVDDNIILLPGEDFSWQCLPGTIIDQNTLLTFTGTGTNKALVVFIYFK